MIFLVIISLLVIVWIYACVKRFTYWKSKFKTCTIETYACVVDIIKEIPKGNRGYSYRYVFEYSDEKGINTVSSNYTSFKLFNIGENITILLDKSGSDLIFKDNKYNIGVYVDILGSVLHLIFIIIMTVWMLNS